MHSSTLRSTFLFVLLISFTTANALAQAPEQFSFQGIVRDGNGFPLGNKTISLQITLDDVNAPGTNFFVEEHNNITTSQNGVFSIVVGDGSTVSGTFPTTQWGTNQVGYSLDIDTTNATYTTTDLTVALQPFQSAPYALHAANAGSTPGWELGGNAGTDTTSDYIGTSDNMGLVFGTNGQEALFLYEDQDVRIGAAHPTFDSLQFSSNTLRDPRLYVNGNAGIQTLVEADQSNLTYATNNNAPNNQLYASNEMNTNFVGPITSGAYISGLRLRTEADNVTNSDHWLQSIYAGAQGESNTITGIYGSANYSGNFTANPGTTAANTYTMTGVQGYAQAFTAGRWYNGIGVSGGAARPNKGNNIGVAADAQDGENLNIALAAFANTDSTELASFLGALQAPAPAGYGFTPQGADNQIGMRASILSVIEDNDPRAFGIFAKGPRHYLEGNIGIGTVDPQHAIHVTDDNVIRADNGARIVVETNDESTPGGLFFINGGQCVELYMNNSNVLQVHDHGAVGGGTTPCEQ